MEKEILKLLGDKLTINEFLALEKILNKPFRIDDDMRIKIQDMAKEVGKGITGSQFGNWLNKVIVPEIMRRSNLSTQQYIEYEEKTNSRILLP